MLPQMSLYISDSSQIVIGKSLSFVPLAILSRTVSVFFWPVFVQESIKKKNKPEEKTMLEVI